MNRVGNPKTHGTQGGHCNRHLLPGAVALVVVTGLMSASPAIAQTTDGGVQETSTEPNDSFGDRLMLERGTTQVAGELSSDTLSQIDYQFSGTLAAGAVDSYTVSDLTPGTPFYAWIDYSEPTLDTMLAVLDDMGTMIDYNDDGSPVGTGLASAIGGVVNPDGTIQLSVTSFGDFNFDGQVDPAEMGVEAPIPHSGTGNYDVYVRLGTDSFDGDIDYLSFSGLEPASYFTVDVRVSDFFPLVAWLDDEGNLISRGEFVQDRWGEVMQVRGVVPRTGDINLVVTGDTDFEFSGTHLTQGTYELILDVETAD